MGNNESNQNIPNSLKISPNFKFLDNVFEDNSTINKNGVKIITKSSFNKLFLGEDTYLANLLYKHFVDVIEDHDIFAEMQKHAFINGFDILLKLEIESEEMAEYYLKVFSEGQKLSQPDLMKFLVTLHEVYKSHSAILLAPPQEDGVNIVEAPKNIEALAKCLVCDGKETVCKESISRQVLKLCPRLFSDVHWWVLRSLSKIESSHQINLHYKQCPKIQLITDSSVLDCLLDQTSLWVLSVSIPQVFLKKQEASIGNDNYFFSVQWKQLYNSNEHGLSHNRFKHHCFSYHGPTVMIILLADEIRLVLTLDNEWKDSSKCYGDSSTRLYQLCPEFKLLGENNIVLYNERSRGLPVGLTLGANPGKPVVSLLDGLTQAKINYLGISQEKCVERIEVWGCAGIKADVDQKKQQKWQDKQAEQLQKVKLPGQWDENPDKALLEMAGVTTEHAQR